LEAAIRDVSPDDVAMVRLAGPSMCPGHFDLQPSKIVELSRCRLLVRFDFQQALDGKIADRPVDVLSVTVLGGLCEPATYLGACRQVAERLEALGLIPKGAAERRMEEIERRIATLSKDVHQKMDAAGLRDAPVLTSGHQSAFCRWLGLRPVGVFSAGDTAGTAEIDDAVASGAVHGVKIIVANEPEGRRLADALADRFDARVVVFANFPDSEKNGTFDTLVRKNVATLLVSKKP
jgi:ABC-type Zn uptake system ZnuABC Zn-binding protein ZnuA